jgi:predicted chitinase
MKLTTEFLIAATRCSGHDAITYLEHLQKYLDAFGVNTPKNLFAFLAQSAHESRSFAVTEESLNY